MGNMAGPLMPFLQLRSTMTAHMVTSLPVPAVVGMAMRGSGWFTKGFPFH